MESRQIVEGIQLTNTGLATVDPTLNDVLFDLALRLEEANDLPVDVQHVLAAIVLAANGGDLDADAKIVATDDSLVELLNQHVIVVFRDFGGEVGNDD
ncbi:MAG: hypothetical protein GY768_19090 [Planctomycetaceae bacterium]|nr:hypothetical protein [Planctomycetaceae bacterium]